VASAKQLLAAQSWSVEYMGDAFDDARMVDGRWYYRNIIAKDFQPFHFQKRVIPLHKNPSRAGGRGAK
jgi:hypothetical protein